MFGADRPVPTRSMLAMQGWSVERLLIEVMAVILPRGFAI